MIRQINDYVVNEGFEFFYRKIPKKIFDCSFNFNFDFCTFDTETTTIAANYLWNTKDRPVSFVYLYQFYINRKVFLFRYENEFLSFFDQLLSELVELDEKLVIYVHNLSFEFQFFKNLFEITDYFATKKRHILKCIISDRLEFRCSYSLSNMSLEKFSENYASKYVKSKEKIDYEIIRYPWSELDYDVLYYSVLDVLSLYDSVHNIMIKEGDNLQSIPLTNTGYVRRDYKSACLSSKKSFSKASADEYRRTKKYREMFYNMKLNYEQYRMCERAFRGGNTHANRNYSGLIIENVGSFDLSSAYPWAIIHSSEFPMGRLMEVKIETAEKLEYYIENYFLIMDIELYSPVIRKNVTVPYLSLSNCRYDYRKDIIVDNGRIFSAKGCVIETTILGFEIAIIRNQYEGKFRIKKAYYTRKGRLPYEVRKTCYDYYKKKTMLKDVDGKEYEYMKSKNKVNSTFGMMVEKIIKNIIEMQDDVITERRPTEIEAKEQLKNYYTPMQGKFLAYQWGITVTAIVRKRLQKMIDIMGDDFVYCDTDSAKCLNYKKYISEIEKLNDYYISQMDSSMSYAIDSYGNKRYLGNAEIDGIYEKFCTLGSKKYCAEQNGKLEITIAGVPKKEGSKILGSIYNFRPGFIFSIGDNENFEKRNGWKKLLTYNEDDYYVEVEGHSLHITSNIAITRTTYTLDITSEYNSIISGEYDYILSEIDVWH